MIMCYLEKIIASIKDISKKHYIGRCEVCHGLNAKICKATIPEPENNWEPQGSFIFLCDSCYENYLENVEVPF
jgi:hypothetical protein